MQQALRQSPGTHSAVLLLRAKDPERYLDVVSAAATLLQYFEDPNRVPGNIFVLLGFGSELLKYVAPNDEKAEIQWPEKARVTEAFAAIARGRGEIIDEQHDVLLQIAANTELDRTHALRAASLLLGDLVEWKEILGARIRGGEEAFGFSDGSADAYAAQTVPAVFEQFEERSTGGSWLWFELIEQDVFKFYETQSTPEARARIIGRAPALVRPASKDNDAFTARNLNALATFDVRAKRAALAAEADKNSDSHIKRMHAYRELILRRGFPCRVEGREGLAFIAAARDVNSFPVVLEQFAGDPLTNFVTRKGGGLFFCPGSARFVDSVQPWKPHPAFIGSQNPIDLTAYELPTAEGTYLGEVRKVLGRFMVGTLGEATLAPIVDAVFGVLDAQFSIDSDRAQEFRKLRAEVLRTSNIINGLLSTYFTKG